MQKSSVIIQKKQIVGH